MGARFKLILTNITEEQLGPIFAKLPDEVEYEIQKAKVESAFKGTPTQRHSQPADIAAWIVTMPKHFRAADFAKVISENGYNPNSISHFLRRATVAKLIKKTPGSQGTLTTYEKL